MKKTLKYHYTILINPALPESVPGTDPDRPLAINIEFPHKIVGIILIRVFRLPVSCKSSCCRIQNIQSATPDTYPDLIHIIPGQ